LRTWQRSPGSASLRKSYAASIYHALPDRISRTVRFVSRLVRRDRCFLSCPTAHPQGPAGPEPFALIFIVLLLVNLAPLGLGYVLLGLTHHPATLIKFSIGSFLISCALSIAIEYGICRKVSALKDIRRLLMTLAIGNVAGYAVAAATIWQLGPLGAL
jgi:hypothetical protein